MLESSPVNMLDELDKQILAELQENGRISNADLARQINLSSPATHARLRRLEEQGYIRGYVALLDRDKMGYDMLCFVRISLQIHQLDQVERFRAAVNLLPEILECHHVTGEFDYLLKIAVRNRHDLEQFMMRRLTPIPGIARIYTSLALTEVKGTTALPVNKD